MTRQMARAEFCDFSLFIRAPAETLRARLIGRNRRSGITTGGGGNLFGERTDGPNVRRC